MNKLPALFSAIGLTLVLLAMLGISLTAQAAPGAKVPQAPNAAAIRISQAYGGGGATTGAPAYKYDFVELFNSGTGSVDISGWSLQYGSATGDFASTAAALYTFTTGTTIVPGKYLLVQLGAVGTAGPSLSVTPDFTTTNLSMAATNGKVALANISTALGCGAFATPCTLPDSRIVDLVAWGNVTATVEITAVNYPTALNNTQGAVRKNNGCQDTDNNFLDFTVVASPTLIPRNSASPANLCVVPEADLALVKTGPSTANAGEAITYTINLSNTGTATATLSILTDTLPTEISFVTYTTALTVSFSRPDAQTLVWDLGDVIGGANNLQITVQGTVSSGLSSGTSFTNTVTASTTATETTTANNTSSATTLAVTAPQLSIAKTVATAHPIVNLGEVVTYTLTLSNSGNGAATGVLITDVLPTAVNFGGFVQQNSATFSSGAITWSGSLNANAAATVVFTATVKNDQNLYGTNITNTVQFTSGNGGGGSANTAFAIVKRYFVYMPLIQR